MNILEIQDDQGTKIITEQQEIEREIKNYYENLYENYDDHITINSIDEFLGNTQNTKLNDIELNSLEGEITIEELTNALKKSNNNSSPGSTGFTYAFYKTFWLDLKQFILNAANHSFNTGILPVSQRVGIINLIPKGNKPKEKLTNWRPITLLNCIYKLTSGTIAERLNNILPILIHPDQSGFVRGRYIGECIRTTYDTLSWAKQNNKIGLLLLIDFEKAFDSISFKYIDGVLNYFGFKQDIKKWINILLRNFTAVINHAGNISSIFNINRGCRQGDPIASVLFILCIEILAIKIRNSGVRGFNLGTVEVLISLYADDCTMYLEYDSENLRLVVNILSSFFCLSGLKIQVSKTQCTVIGVTFNNNLRLCGDIELIWKSDFTLLGIKFDALLEHMDVNINSKIVEIEKTMGAWEYRFLTPYGRACVVKTLIIPKLTHISLAIPTLNKITIKRIEDLCYKFIWKGTDKIARTDAKTVESKGGLNFPDINSSWIAFKISWLRRLYKTRGDTCWVKIFMQLITEAGFPNSMHNFFNHITDLSTSQRRPILANIFWSECISAIKPTMLEFRKEHPEVYLYSSFWGSQIYRRNNSTIKKTFFLIYQCILKPP